MRRPLHIGVVGKTKNDIEKAEERMTSSTSVQSLPRVSDSWSFVYVESARVERQEYGIHIVSEQGVVRPPIAQFLVLMLGPGSSMTQAAATLLAERGCSVVWCGEAGVRFYGHASAETSYAVLAEAQALAWASPSMRTQVAQHMYRMRFAHDHLDATTTIDQLRGLEGTQMRTYYARLAREHGMAWSGRSTHDDVLADAPLQQAINVANSCLYGVCHAAIVAVGLNPALGFMHRGNQRSFVFDVADLYKADVVLPLAFAAAAAGERNLAQRVRRACRDAFRTQRLLERIVPDMYALMRQPRPVVHYHDYADQGGSEVSE